MAMSTPPRSCAPMESRSVLPIEQSLDSRSLLYAPAPYPFAWANRPGMLKRMEPGGGLQPKYTQPRPRYGWDSDYRVVFDPCRGRLVFGGIPIAHRSCGCTTCAYLDPTLSGSRDTDEQGI